MTGLYSIRTSAGSHWSSPELGNTGLGRGRVAHAEGGEVPLLDPPELGYGDRAVGKIPANSVIVFEVELVDVRTAGEAKAGEKK